MSLRLGDDNSLSALSTRSMHFSWFRSIYLIWFDYFLSVEFTFELWKQKIWWGWAKFWKNRSWSWIENLIDLRSKDCSLRWRVAQRSGSRFPCPIKAPGRNRKHHCITILINCARYRSFVYYLSGWDTLRCFYSHLVDPSNACAD